MKSEELKHLELIQAVISRMTINSFTVKGWSIAIVTGLFALSAITEERWTSILPIIPVISFWGLDTFYLRQEKLFRELYDHARKEYINNSKSFDLLSMNTKPYDTNIKNFFSLAFSKSIVWFHLTVSILVLAVVAYLTKF